MAVTLQMSHAVIMLNGHANSTFLHMPTKIQKTATIIPHILPTMCQKQICPSNTAYMQHMQVSTCLHICQHIPHMMPLQSIISLQTLVYIYFTSLAYAPDEICLPHCTYVPPDVYHSLNIDPTLLHKSVKN